MSKWLVARRWVNTEDEYGRLLCSADAHRLPENTIVQFQGDLPTENEIKALQCRITYGGERHYYLILFMQKLGEEVTDNGNDK